MIFFLGCSNKKTIINTYDISRRSKIINSKILIITKWKIHKLLESKRMHNLPNQQSLRRENQHRRQSNRFEHNLIPMPQSYHHWPPWLNPYRFTWPTSQHFLNHKINDLKIHKIIKHNNFMCIRSKSRYYQWWSITYGKTNW